MSLDKIQEDVHKVRLGDKEFLLIKVKENEIRRLQDKVRNFAEARNWTNNLDDPRDYLLGIVEEVGEFRNFVKWINNRDSVNKLIEENFDYIENTLGDILWFIFMLANRCGIDVKKAIEKVIEDNEKRFPVDLVKGKHTNIFAGGIDLKFKKPSDAIV
jgi:NTP pyrophosphatase (non-canonical NTP hydrolase)